MKATMPRRFFITENRLIGTGPPSMTASDEVYMLFGGDVPFILSDSGKLAVVESEHESQKLYYLRSDAYVVNT
jgi:hypothetical protein